MLMGWVLGIAGAAHEGHELRLMPPTEFKWAPGLWTGVEEGSGKTLGEGVSQRPK